MINSMNWFYGNFPISPRQTAKQKHMHYTMYLWVTNVPQGANNFWVSTYPITWDLELNSQIFIFGKLYIWILSSHRFHVENINHCAKKLVRHKRKHNEANFKLWFVTLPKRKGFALLLTNSWFSLKALDRWHIFIL